MSPDHGHSSVSRAPLSAGLKRALLALAAAALLALLFFAAWSFESKRELQRLQGLLDAQAIELDRQLENLGVLPQILATDPRLIEALIADSPAALARANALLKQVQLQTEISDAYVMSAAGLTVAASNHDQPDSFVANNYSFRPYFKHAIEGLQSSQYAVGSTTGIPGYFVAHPIYADRRVIGVVALKLSLSHLPESWRRQAHSTLVLDQFGVVILTTDQDMLYARTQALSDLQTQQITREHYYPIAPAAALDHAPDAHQLQRGKRRYLAASHTLRTEQWQLLMLSPQSSVALYAALYCLAALALATVVLLLLRSYRYQQLLATAEQRNARKLERQVQARTLELEQAQEALIVESNFAVLGRMSGAINHEVNQPLTSLRFNLATLRQLIEQPALPLDDIRDTVVDCDRTTKRISRVVEALRSIARPGNASFSSVDTTALLEDVVQTVRRERPQVSDWLDWQAPTEQHNVEGNQVLLQQALLNLLYNAFDAVMQQEQPAVLLRVSAGSSQVHMRVADNGPGVDPALRDKLFTPFVQGASRKQGLGLGLALARQIAERHHGDLIYKPGTLSGSEFSLSIPRHQPAPPATQSKAHD